MILSDSLIRLPSSKFRSFLNPLLTMFWNGTIAPGRELFLDIEYSFTRAHLLVRAFYAGLLYIAFENLKLMDSYLNLTYSQLIEPLWPVAWISPVSYSLAVHLILLLFVGGSLLATVYPSNLIARLLAFLGCLQFYAFFYSFGEVSHRHHTLVLIALIFVFLPLNSKYNQFKLDYLRVFWGAQTLLLLIYSMTGLWKVAIGLQQMFHGEIGIFHINALPAIIANVHFVQSNEATIFSSFLLRYPLVSYPLFLGILYIEVFAIMIAFRPNLHRLWAISLIGMHIGIALTLRLYFSTQVLAVALLLLASPFAPSRLNWQKALYDLPMFGPFLSALSLKLSPNKIFSHDKNRIVVYYDGTCGICNGLVRLMLRLSPPLGLFFAKQEGKAYAQLKARYSYLEPIDSIVIQSEINGEETIHVRSEGILWVLSRFHGVYGYLFILFLLIPSPVLDIGYSLNSLLRKRLVFLRETCLVLSPEQCKLFLD